MRSDRPLVAAWAVGSLDEAVRREDGLKYELTTPEGTSLGSSRRSDTVMTSLHTVLSRHRALRAHLRDDRAIARAMAAAPTLESAHEIAALAAHR